ncbi:MAG: hypothetical protein FWD60_04280 [Candidatus Azobacteroides sp.]|nr:hypothetical protein [Candidatus Azobacteroides sp.]
MKKVLVLLIISYPFVASFGLQPKWRFNLDGGMGYLLSSYSADKKSMTDLGFDPKKVDDYYNKFNLGFQGNADIQRMFNRNWGAGIKYSFFVTNASLFEPAYWGFTPVKVGMEETMYINYVGPSIHVRSFIDQGKSLLITSTASLGFAHYKDNSKVYGMGISFPEYHYAPFLTNNIPINATSSSWGLDWGVGLEYFLSPEFSLGMDMGFFYSSFNDFNIKIDNDYTFNSKDVEINVARVYVSLGLRMYLY